MIAEKIAIGKRRPGSMFAMQGWLTGGGGVFSRVQDSGERKKGGGERTPREKKNERAKITAGT